MDTEIISALISSVVGGILVAFLNFLLTKNKTNAEIKKMKAEADKFTAEAEKTRAEIKQLSMSLGEANYYDNKVNEILLYDGRKGVQGYDIWSDYAKYSVQQGIINFTDRDGGFWLKRYIYDGKELPSIPRKIHVSGERKIRISCELKAISATYDVAFYIQDAIQNEDEFYDDLGRQEISINHTEWVKTDFHFRIRVDVDWFVFIASERTSGNGSFQIRNLVVAERVD